MRYRGTLAAMLIAALLDGTGPARAQGPTPTATATSATATCEVLVRINGIEGWLTEPVEFCGR